MAKRKKGTWGGSREGSGRPSSFRDPVDRFIRFERAEAESADEIAGRRGVSFAEIVREALRQYVKRAKRG